MEEKGRLFFLLQVFNSATLLSYAWVSVKGRPKKEGRKRGNFWLQRKREKREL